MRLPDHEVTTEDKVCHVFCNRFPDESAVQVAKS
jgi:hypothetical protein